MMLQRRPPQQAGSPTGNRAGESPERGANRGQIILMFALFLTALLGMLGLAIDLGFSFAQKRTIQGAADLAASAGARAVARYYDAPETEIGDQITSALPDVAQIVSDNHVDGTTTELESCTYIDTGGQDVGACSISVPSNAMGVHVSVSETHRTFFIRIIPGAPVYVTTRATASAQLERMDLAGMDSPFIVCGYDTVVPDTDPDPDDESPPVDILLEDYTVNPAAIGQTFRLSGPNRADISRCGAGVANDALSPEDPDYWEATTTYGSRWRGLSDKTANSGKRVVLEDASTSTWWNPLIGSPGSVVSTLTNKVHGVEGCPELATKPFDCIMLLPIATDYDSSIRRFKVTKVMAFRVWRDDANLSTFWGQLLDDYLVYGASVPLSVDRAPWCRDCGSVLVVRLAE